MEEVPRVDLPTTGAPVPSQTAHAIRGALEALGFVRIAGHGIDPTLVRGCYDAFERFFSLPDATKRRYSGTRGGQRGYTAFGVEHARDHPVPDLKEFFHVGQALPPARPLGDAYPPNVWPAEVPELEGLAMALFRALERCATRILAALAHSYGVPEARFATLAVEGNSILRAVHYPAVAVAAPEALRAAPHEDINLITLLCGATAPGLEIHSRGRWIAVEHAPEEIVVDTGDMLSRLTNGVLPATTHRVVQPATQNGSRFALPFFSHPRAECSLTAEPPFVGPERALRAPPTTAGDYLQERLREIGLTE